MLKMALFDCAINEKCYSVDGGRGICKKNANAWGSPRGGGGCWVQVELTDA